MPQFLELARLAIAATDLKVVLTIDDAAESAEVAAARLPAQRFSHIAGQLPFAVLDALVSHCLALISNDTGPKHLAALRGTKVVSIHGARANWREWGQGGDGLIITRDVPCAGCGIIEIGACGKGHACLAHIRADEVWSAVQQMLN